MKINSDILNYADKNNKTLKDITSVSQKTTKQSQNEDRYINKSIEENDKNLIELYLEEKRAALLALNQKEQMESDLRASEAEIAGMVKMYDILIKCMKIASRIISGDKVPAQDEKLLLENYPEIYSSAKTLAKQNDEAKEHDSLADEIEEDAEPAAATDNSELRSKLNTAIGELEQALVDIAAE